MNKIGRMRYSSDSAAPYVIGFGDTHRKRPKGPICLIRPMAYRPQSHGPTALSTHPPPDLFRGFPTKAHLGKDRVIDVIRNLDGIDMVVR